MKSKGSMMIALAGLALAGNPLLAHHGDAGRYDDASTTVVGTVVEFQFVNPHSIVTLDVTDEGGNVERWHGELGAPNSLARNWGWSRETLKPGETLTMTGRARKNGEPYMTLSEGSRLVDANGKELFNGDE